MHQINQKTSDGAYSNVYLIWGCRLVIKVQHSAIDYVTWKPHAYPLSVGNTAGGLLNS